MNFLPNNVSNEFEAIFKYANEGIIIINSRSCIIKINPAGLRLFGYEKEKELEGKEIEVLIPKRFSHNHVKEREGYNKSPHARAMGLNSELFGLKKDQQEFAVEVSLSPFEIDENKFVICFVIDISTRKRIELSEKEYQKDLEREVEERTLILKEAIQKLEKTKNELDESLKREQELNTMKTKFISIASHEFRTPLSTVLSSLSLVEKYSDMNEIEKRNKHIDRIKKSVRHLTDILNDILSVNKIEEGQVFAIPQNVNLNQFILELNAELQGLLKQNQKIIFNFETTDDEQIFQDPKLLRPILINLMSNAIKFSGENTEIKITAVLDKIKVHISVEDQGIGIPEEDQKKLFTRFFRSGNVENIQGTGLGLSIVNQYLTFLNGTINFKSEVNKGSKFIVNLPRILNTQTKDETNINH